ncbi:hypothetical protein [Calothrix rhizosoleniae]|uniref:hypothetical protein n=1 Tax=Calothrix rhizosoleniae TaxID=888997 RepID=UPI000B4A2A95|nr:hypothetical protein [Calothrix rhizosoleniae]
MKKILDEELSLEIGDRIKSKGKKPFDNAYQAALSMEGVMYIQGFLVSNYKPYQPIEHAWVELTDTSSEESIIRIVDPTLKHLRKNTGESWYFPAHSLTVKQLKAIIEESQEDYPEDDPLPIYGDAPYEYYGDVMLGDKEYLVAYQAAVNKCQELNQPNVEKNGK